MQKKITDHSVYYADKVDEKLSVWVESTKEKAWAKKLMGFFKKSEAPQPNPVADVMPMQPDKSAEVQVKDEDGPNPFEEK